VLVRLGQECRHIDSVMGFDGGVGAGLLHPSLTSVVIPVEDTARRVVGQVLRQIEDGQDTEPGEIVATWLREGESTPVHR
jgi:DNA-binding LacI/PurR family transcriptional regulator